MYLQSLNPQFSRVKSAMPQNFCFPVVQGGITKCHTVWQTFLISLHLPYDVDRLFLHGKSMVNGSFASTLTGQQLTKSLR